MKIVLTFRLILGILGLALLYIAFFDWMDPLSASLSCATDGCLINISWEVAAFFRTAQSQLRNVKKSYILIGTILVLVFSVVIAIYFNEQSETRNAVTHYNNEILPSLQKQLSRYGSDLFAAIKSRSGNDSLRSFFGKDDQRGCHSVKLSKRLSTWVIDHKVSEIKYEISHNGDAASIWYGPYKLEVEIDATPDIKNASFFLKPYFERDFSGNQDQQRFCTIGPAE